ncbi:hypothetical protein K503DRAFT_308375 [Rhizopogon vinicolor AM-OR11-026]|uniref:Heterokaryon incompatibility domain-containing protein n=1 Tax=Rhizopogon vinicolor AM-OR11-026 TaxID=1314800 RepID=A0A1B7ND55_9AGAM|nr:hypothetical protein K503DRAFT_308375 [Rhizopogon vinicolor AM-OR11-026]
MSSEYKELLSSTTKHANLRTDRIKEVVATYFRRVMLSHRWEGNEPLLHNIQGRVVYQLNPVGGILKLQSFCKIVRGAGYQWAWSDTCCIDKNNNFEVQTSLNSMFIWYSHSALTIVYLSDALSSSNPGALAESAWIKRGWTVQEFLAPKVILFYQKDWTIYLSDRSPNHKESVAIMQELGDATGIDPRALVAFRPGMRGAREKLQWASTRVTTMQEDVAYSLFGLFGVHLPIIYGEKKQNALGRLLQEIVAQSGDISALDWVGKSSSFNSCLPADIACYEATSCTLPFISEDEMQTSVSSLRDAGVVSLASELYTILDNLNAPRFSHRRLHLPCIAFRITEVRLIQTYAQDQETCATYEVKADGLRDLQITTDDKLAQFSPARPTWQTFLLVRPWNRYLLGLPDAADDTQDVEDLSPPTPSYGSLGGSHGENGLGDSDPQSRALRLIVRLGRPFSVFLLARQHGGEYKRIASDHDIITQVKGTASESVRNMMDVRTLEIS